MKHGIIARILISLLGISLILWGAGEISLAIAGEKTSAVITNIRREGGERSDGKPGRYTYNISYTFSLPGGKNINGLAKKIGNSVYLKADGTSTANIKYLPAFPYLNSMKNNLELLGGSVIFIISGTALIFLVNRKQATRQR
ncbi:MAG: hypothetical protein VB120_06135 [Lachnospiraceae bacterium]|nr:hypothetical protein [Lachnospiraceae bacterium]